MSERKEKEQKRIPMHEQRLVRKDLPIRDGYQGKWVWGTEYDAHILAGWTPIENKDTQTHDGQVQLESQFGSYVTRLFNRGYTADKDRRIGILMEIPVEYYQEDFNYEQNKIDEAEKTWDPTKALNNPSFYGKIDMNSD